MRPFALAWESARRHLELCELISKSPRDKTLFQRRKWGKLFMYRIRKTVTNSGLLIDKNGVVILFVEHLGLSKI